MDYSKNTLRSNSRVERTAPRATNLFGFLRTLNRQVCFYIQCSAIQPAHGTFCHSDHLVRNSHVYSNVRNFTFYKFQLLSDIRLIIRNYSQELGLSV
uniref:Uncharacterized protein n=1 Tax=Trichogramma kaykai TaxID=54128 RepID=A0ABD2X146_9HYME